MQLTTHSSDRSMRDPHERTNNGKARVIHTTAKPTTQGRYCFHIQTKKKKPKRQPITSVNRLLKKKKIFWKNRHDSTGDRSHGNQATADQLVCVRNKPPKLWVARTGGWLVSERVFRDDDT